MDDIKLMAKRLAVFNQPYAKLRTMPTGWSSPFIFTLKVPKGKGFCEFVIEMVSELARSLRVSTDNWFTNDLTIRQETLVLVGIRWVEYGLYLANKYPIHPEMP